MLIGYMSIPRNELTSPAELDYTDREWVDSCEPSNSFLKWDVKIDYQPLRLIKDRKGSIPNLTWCGLEDWVSISVREMNYFDLLVDTRLWGTPTFIVSGNLEFLTWGKAPVIKLTVRCISAICFRLEMSGNFPCMPTVFGVQADGRIYSILSKVRGKLSPCEIKHHSMKTHGGVEAQLRHHLLRHETIAS